MKRNGYSGRQLHEDCVEDVISGFAPSALTSALYELKYVLLY